MEKIRTQLMNNGFTLDQIAEIKAGFDAEVDITAYADREFLAIQMRQIRYGLEAWAGCLVFQQSDVYGGGYGEKTTAAAGASRACRG